MLSVLDRGAMDFEPTTRRIVWLAVAFEGGLALLALGLGWLPGVQSPLPKIHWITPLAGIVLASLLFGLMHPITPFYVVLAALMGAFLGWIFIVTDNLLPAIITHGLYDFLALTYLTRLESR